MKTALLFPGQAAQFVGMGSDIADSDGAARSMIQDANEILGYDLGEIMFEGPDELLKETRYTQPAVFLHSMLIYNRDHNTAQPEAMAGHSLGEITACVAAGVLSFEDGLTVVRKRAEAMQIACETNPGTMAAILGMEDKEVESICERVEGVVAANYNCPGQIVISGTRTGIPEAIELCREAGARRAMEIPVGGAFHSPLMQPAMDAFQDAISSMEMRDASCPIYQNVDAQAHTAAENIRQNLIRQVTQPVLWTSSVQNMMKDGFIRYIEVGGKGRILSGMVRKISRDLETSMWQEK